MFACFIQWTLPSIEKMKPAALLVAIIVLLASCSSTCELDYYENVSGIRFTSSLHPEGNNVVIFEQDKMECTKVTLKKVSLVNLGSTEIR